MSGVDRATGNVLVEAATDSGGANKGYARFKYTSGSPGGGNDPAAYSGEVTEYGCYGLNGLKYNYNQVQSSQCVTEIALTDVNGDGYPDVVSSDGVYKTSAMNTPFFNFTVSVGADTAVIAVDVNSDTFGDVLLLTNTTLHFILSTPKVSATYAPVLRVQNASCSFDPSTNEITVIAIGVGAPDTTNLHYSAIMRNSFGSTSGVINGWPTNNIVLPVPDAGNYTVTMTVEEQYSPYETASATCSVNAQFIPEIGPSDVFSKCTIGDENADGSFNFNDDITNHNWYPVVAYGGASGIAVISTNSPTSDGIILNMLQSSASIFHPILCQDKGLNLTARVYVDALTNFKVVVQGQQNGANLDVGAFQMAATSLKDAASNSIADAISVGWHVVELDLDQSIAYYSIKIDGVEKGGGEFLNNMNGEFSYVYIYNLGGTSRIDWIATNGLTGIIRDTRNDTEQREDLAKQKLNSCVDASERDFSVNPPGTVNYPNVDMYCKTQHPGEIGKNALCTLDELKNALEYNGRCYKEVYDYCVGVIYPAGGVAGSSKQSVQTGMDGASACAVSLGLNIGANKVIVPFADAFWLVLKGNWFIIGIIVLLVIIVVASKNKR
jgi:hypothetical protein